MDSAVKRMPPEMLAEIFSWTLAPAMDAIEREYHPTDSPWVLTHVSHHWRAVALSTPMLWSLVAITFNLDTSSTSFPLPMLETQISRAHKLKVHLHGSEISDPGFQIETFKCLVKHASRWEELSLTLTSFLFPLLADLRGRLPLLRRMAIVWDDKESGALVDSIDCFELAPSLTDLSIVNRYRFIPVSFPARQLTRYDLDAPWDIHRALLKLTPNLLEARILICFDNEDFSGSETIQLPYLQRLHVSPPHALNFLRFPFLEELSTDLYDDTELVSGPNPVDSYAYGVAELEVALMRSSCPIQKLCIEGCSNAHMIAALLQKFRSIVEFTIITDTPSASAQAEILMELLNEEAAGSRVVAPQLGRLSFGWVDDGSFDCGRFLKLVKYRWEAKSCALRSVALFKADSESRPDTPVLRGLEALRTDGLDVVWLEDRDASIVMDDYRYHPQWT
ncbi:hypothetical protein DFH06DRAFT_1416469 [Mycena polygramma]|nr:hypothetical protein DFH06DRAFT_1416469 [Mycena polygramma]